MSKRTFTTDVLDWEAWITPVDLSTATPDQLAVLEESGPHARTSQYYHVLLHDAPALRERSALFNAIMYGPGGLPRADRELGAAVELIVNGCVYCTSVHARFYVQLAKRQDVIDRLFADGVGAELEPRERAIADFSAKLAQTPPQAGAGRNPSLAQRRPLRLRHRRSRRRGRDVRLGEPADADARRAEEALSAFRCWLISGPGVIARGAARFLFLIRVNYSSELRCSKRAIPRSSRRRSATSPEPAG